MDEYQIAVRNKHNLRISLTNHSFSSPTALKARYVIRPSSSGTWAGIDVALSFLPIVYNSSPVLFFQNQLDHG